jgi:hypothetical protein
MTLSWPWNDWPVGSENAGGLESTLTSIIPKCVGPGVHPVLAKIPLGKNYMASPEHFFGPLDAAGAVCRHEPQQDFTVPYELPHRANGYSGSGVWHFRRSRSGHRYRACAAFSPLNGLASKAGPDRYASRSARDRVGNGDR